MLSERLSTVEMYGFDRASFPLSVDGHDIIVLANDCYVDAEDRLSVHLTLQCRTCDAVSTLRGRAAAEVEWQLCHLQDVKIAALGGFPETCG